MRQILSLPSLTKPLAAGLVAFMALGIFACAPMKKPSPPKPVAKPLPKAPPRRVVTVAHRMLYLERDLGADQGDLALLTSLLDLIGQEIKPRGHYTAEDAVYTLLLIHNTIHAMYEYSPHRLLSTGLKGHQLDCDLLTAIYLSVGQQYGLPLKAVVVPRHTFIRWVWPDGTHLNWETTAGEDKSDLFYMTGRYLKGVLGRPIGAHFSIKAGQESGAYMLSMGPDKFLAISHVNLGNGYLEREKKAGGKRRSPTWREGLAKALEHFKAAIELDPKRVEAFLGLGMAYYMAGDRKAAIRNLGQAARLFPLEPDIFFTRALVRLTSGQYRPAVKDLLAVYKLDPGHPTVPFYLHEAYRRLGDAKNADLWWKRMQTTTQRF